MPRIKTWEELTIQDNFLFQKVMQNKRICKHLIERILHIRIEKITFPDMEKTISVRYDSKSVRLDVYVQDETGRVFDIEMQCTNGPNDELPKRTRYYQGMIDMELLEKGKMYEELNPAYIIFICTFDPFHQGLPIYTFRNRCLEKEDLELGDQTTKLFLNSKGNCTSLDPDVAAFLTYVDGKAAEGKFVKAIEKEVIRLKKHEETRREYMTYAMELERWKRACREESLEEGREEGRKEGREEGREEAYLAVAQSLLELGLPVEMVASSTKLPMERILALQQQLHNKSIN